MGNFRSGGDYRSYGDRSKTVQWSSNGVRNEIFEKNRHSISGKGRRENQRECGFFAESPAYMDFLL